MSEIEIHLLQIEQAFDHRSWHGPNLLGSIRGLKYPQAVWRPAAGRHSIWENILHAAYWKSIAARRLREPPEGHFPRRGSNWFERTAANTPAELKEDIALLKETHEELLAVVSEFDPKRLDRRRAGGESTFRDLIVGIAAHDVYHAGQIQLLKGLQKGS